MPKDQGPPDGSGHGPEDRDSSSVWSLGIGPWSFSSILLHLVEQVAQLFLLGPQVAAVVLVGGDLDGHALDDAQVVALHAADFLGVVGQQADVADAEIDEDLGADAVVAQVGAETEPLVG